MKKVSTAAQSQALDRAVIHGLGVPGIALMELASRGVARCVVERLGEPARRGVAVVCGGGNNGGDGYAAARWLAGAGLPVWTVPLSERSEGDAGIMRAAAAAAGVEERDEPGQPGVIIDAVFGTGLSRAVEGRYARWLQRLQEQAVPVVAVDLPSGIDADTGQVLGVALGAAHTVCFGRLKPGLLTEPGASLAGEVHLVDIGLEAAGGPWAAELPEPADLAAHWPVRAPTDHKTRSGHLLVVAGSRAMAGAALLCCRGALGAGAGLVSLCTPRGALSRVAALPPEVMLRVGPGEDRLEDLPGELLRGVSALAVGPGLGGGKPLPRSLEHTLGQLWRRADLPMVFDADALGCTGPPADRPRILCPHPGEAARLLDQEIAAVQADRFAAAARLARRGVALLKGPHSLVAEAGRPISVNPTGHPALATGGSGDVLTGILGALLARGCSSRMAARLGAWVHGRAGELVGQDLVEGATASDVARALPHAVAALRAKR